MEITDKSKIYDFLKGHPVGILATVDDKGLPHASAIYFTIEDDNSITFTTKRDTKKHQNMKHSNHVMLVVYEAESQTTVNIEGSAEPSSDPKRVQEVFAGTLKAAKQTGDDTVPPIAKIAAGPYVAYTIKPKAIWMSEYGWGDSFANAMKHAGEHHQDHADPL